MIRKLKEIKRKAKMKLSKGDLTPDKIDLIIDDIFYDIELSLNNLPTMTCPECNGTGKIKRTIITTIPYVGDEVSTYEGICNWCNGKGYLEGEVYYNDEKIL